MTYLKHNFELLSRELVTVKSLAPRPLLSAFWMLAGFACLIAAAGSCLLAIVAGTLGQGTIVFGTIMVSASFACVAGAGRLSTDPLPEILENSDSRPILYLRSFDDDSSSGQDLFSVLLGENESVEDVVVQCFKSLGPVLAVGRPNERMAASGASRFYVEDDVWQSVVSDLMRRSQVVVLRGGVSCGLSWEIRKALELVAPEKLVIVFAYGSGFHHDREETYEEIKAAFESHAGVSIPEFDGSQRVLVFDENKTAVTWDRDNPNRHPLNNYIRDIDGHRKLSPGTLFGIRTKTTVRKLLYWLLGLLALSIMLGNLL